MPRATSPGLREWPTETPEALLATVSRLDPFFSGLGRARNGGPLAYRIFFQSRLGPHGALVHVLQYGTDRTWSLAPDDLAALLDVGLQQINCDEPGTVSFYFVLEESTDAIDREFRRRKSV